MGPLSVTAIALVTSLLGQQAGSAPATVPAHASMAVVLKLQYDGIKGNQIVLAERMPAEHYAFRAAPEAPTFAMQVAHIASANVNQCNNLVGRRHDLSGQDLAKTLPDKEGLVGALKQSFTFCDEYFSRLTSNDALLETFSPRVPAGQQVPSTAEKGASASALVAHNNEVYGYLAVYLRLKGLVPPSSDKRK